mmetsp:Transcript_45952/g.117498  ORF Transcript_45952/g.117498 Transcript_45952/m.117498 type:complete len:129 (+) Transcript_45952:74-460(+)
MASLRTVCAPRAVARPALPVAARRAARSPLARRLPQPPRAEPAEKAEAATAKAEPEAAANVCATCGVVLGEMPGGCDGLGRQAGGVGAFIPWWPIKAYRPCPALTASGGKYKRKGQITDEMLFGKGKR